ncbi:dihydrofolate reductase family protein [Nocardia sp. NPDC047038]|uniref:dihydrofolate reductase family protein n=1 Tax=Nocardia sp. NPDC047038 TaxID=3154338 RepID=UPI00340D4364
MSKVFSALAVSVDGYITGRDPGAGRGLGDGGTLFVVSHPPAPEISDRQNLSTTGIEDAIAAARETAGDKDVALMGGGVVTEALKAGLVDEVVLHQVPVLLGEGRPFFRALPEQVRLRLVEAVPAPGVTHLHHEIQR